MSSTIPKSLLLTTWQDEVRAAFFTAARLHELQTQRLRAVVTSAARFVPLYRDRYRDHLGWLPALGGPDDLWRLPAVSKEDFLHHGPGGYVYERQELSGLIRQTTSGTSGRALDLYATPLEAATHVVLLWTGWMGRVTTSDRLFYMAAPGLEFQNQFVHNTFIPLRMSERETRAHFQEFRPTVVVGLVDPIALLARDLRRHEVTERRGVRLVFPFGQTLTPMLADMIREGFEGEVFNLYGATETIWMGCECERHDGLHVPLGRVIVQVARLNQPDQPAAPGEPGEVIVTSLARWTTPIIRYRLGDVAALDPTPCPCGRRTPRLKALEGRFHDFLTATAGALVSPMRVATDLEHGQRHILDYRIVQEAPDRVRVWIVPAPGFGDPERRHIAGVIRFHLGPVRVVIELVEQIPPELSGKRRRVHRAFAPGLGEAASRPDLRLASR